MNWFLLFLLIWATTGLVIFAFGYVYISEMFDSIVDRDDPLGFFGRRFGRAVCAAEAAIQFMVLGPIVVVIAVIMSMYPDDEDGDSSP